MFGFFPKRVESFSVVDGEEHGFDFGLAASKIHRDVFHHFSRDKFIRRGDLRAPKNGKGDAFQTEKFRVPDAAFHRLTDGQADPVQPFFPQQDGEKNVARV